jgi:catechol-2,3-dioxygenase
MASSSRKRSPRNPREGAAGKPPAKRRARGVRNRNLIDDVTAVLLISPNARRLCGFYRATLGLPLEEERHGGMPRHFGCSLGDVHFAIHDAAGWPGVATRNARSPVVSFSTSNLEAVARQLSARGVALTGPGDHGFGQVLSFRDPDGNHVSVIEYGPEYW